MSKRQISCPRCRQPVVVDIEQLFDVNIDPKAKQRILSGAFNIIQCQACGYEGMYSSPIVYHDPEKEFLLTYFPPDLGLPVNEQEKLVGPLINQVLNNLPQEKRKAYLLRPQSMFTMQTMIEKILEGDGITKDIIEAQQQRISLIQRLMTTSPESRPEIIKQEESKIDEEFFALFTRLLESVISQGDQQTAQALAGLQKDLLEQTSVGRNLYARSKDAEVVIKKLQEASKTGLTREKLLDIILETSTDTQLSTVVSLARQGMDYNFFELLSGKIDKASGEEKERLIQIRGKLLDLTQKIDQAVQEEIQQTKLAFEELLKAPDIEKATEENLERINNFFVELVQAEFEKAHKDGNLERVAKIQKIVNVLEKASTPPPELQFIEGLLDIEEEGERNKALMAQPEKITPELVQMLSGLISQLENSDQPVEITDRLKSIYRACLKFNMQANLKK